MPRDIDVIVRTLDTPDWVFLPPSRDRVMQDEVHDDARAEIVRRGLPPGSPYAGWHTQQDSSGRDGMLARPQRVYFGGDVARVRERLLRLEAHGFAVLGGGSPDESFVVVRDAFPTAAVAEQLPALATRLRLLADPALLPGAPVPLRAGEEDLLHEILRSPGLATAGAVRPDALLALHRRGLATAADVDAVARGWRETFGTRAAELARVAVDLEHSFAEDLVLDLLADGKAPSDLLLAWGDERAVAATRDQALRGTRRDIAAFLTLAVAHGASRRDAFLDLAEEVRANAPTAGEADAAHHERLDALASLAPGVSLPVADGAHPGRVLAALRDGSLPAWLRAQVATTHGMLPIHLRDGLVRHAWGSPRPFGPGPGPAPEEAQAVVDAWDDAARAACLAAGSPPWPGFAMGSRPSRAWAHETTTSLAPWQVDALRTHLGRDDATEPELATCLELLLVTGHLRVEDVGPLRRGWRDRLLVEPDPSCGARPALVTAATVLLRAGDPTGREIVDVLLASTRAWAAGQRHLLLAEIGHPQDAARLWTAAMVDAPGGREAALAWVLLDARTHGHTAAVAAARGWAALTGPGPGWRRNRLLEAAICWADLAHPVWASTYGTGSVRQVRAALDVAADHRHPSDMRVRALEVATGSSVLRDPATSSPAAVGRDAASGLRDRAAAIGADLGTI